MRRSLRIVAGGIVALIGVVWLLQGVGYLPGSFMTGSVLWAVIGGVCILLGLALMLRRRPG